MVGDPRIDLDAAVHRAWMHHQRVGLGAGELLVIEAEEVEIFPLARDQARGHALALEPQHHDDVGIGQALPHRGIDLDAKPLDAGGEQGGGRDDPDAGAERIEEQDVRPCHSRMEDIAADRHDESFDAPLVTANGERIEERLRRMLVTAVAGIDHRAIHLLGQQLDRAGRMVAYHEDVGAHGVQRHRRVDQGLAFLHRGGRDRHVHHVGAEPFSGELEGALRPGRGLEEKIDQGAAAEVVALLGDLAAELGGLLGKIEQRNDFAARKAFDSKKMAVGKGDGGSFGGNAH